LGSAVNPLEPEAKFVGVLELASEGPLHIGGVRWANVLYLLRLQDGRVLIPSTTWKGAFRSLAKKLVRSLPLSGVERLAVERVSLVDDWASKRRGVSDLLEVFRQALKGLETPLLDPSDVREVLRRVGYDEEEMERPENLPDLLVSYLEYYCPVGRLFGNSVHAATVRFFDTLLNATPVRRPCVGIDRRTGRVMEEVLFFVESILPGTAIRLVMVGEVRRRGDSASRLLAAVLEAVKAVGLSIGGRKSVGYGQLTLRDGYFHLVELPKDREKFGELLANPFKADRLSLEAFTSWLRGSA